MLDIKRDLFNINGTHACMNTWNTVKFNAVKLSSSVVKSENDVAHVCEKKKIERSSAFEKGARVKLTYFSPIIIANP